jgi:hypothetical protein
MLVGCVIDWILLGLSLTIALLWCFWYPLDWPYEIPQSIQVTLKLVHPIFIWQLERACPMKTSKILKSLVKIDLALSHRTDLLEVRSEWIFLMLTLPSLCDLTIWGTQTTNPWIMKILQRYAQNARCAIWMPESGDTFHVCVAILFLVVNSTNITSPYEYFFWS